MIEKFMFVGDHPHAGEKCVEKHDEKVVTYSNAIQWPYKILDCAHGVEWCYATHEQVREVTDERL